MPTQETQCRNASPSRSVPFWMALGLIAATSLAGGCVAARSVDDKLNLEPQVVASALRFHKEYVIAVGDTLEIAVRRTPDVSRTVIVRPDGKISLPIIDDVQAAGLTPQELDNKITDLLSKRLVEPDVTVIAAQVRQPMVYVMGDVNNNAAVVPLRDAPTAAQALTYAGGPRRSASIHDITLIRLSPDGILQAMPLAWNLKSQSGTFISLRGTLLEPDDILFVPENGRSQVARFLDDFVNRPLAGIAALTSTYTNFRFIQELNK